MKVVVVLCVVLLVSFMAILWDKVHTLEIRTETYQGIAENQIEIMGRISKKVDNHQRLWEAYMNERRSE